MRGFAASVAIVASAEAGVRAGIVATAVMSISLTPPSLMVAINRFSSCLRAAFAQAGFHSELSQPRTGRIRIAVQQAQTG